MRYLAAFSLLFTAAVVAAPQDPGGRQGGSGGFPQMASPLATAIDVNHDNTISATEIDGAPAALKTLDRNNDGRLAGDELMPAMGRGGEGRGGEGRGREGGGEGRMGMPGGRGGEIGETPATTPEELVAMLMTFDKNKDGQLERSEVPERIQGIFDRADGDKNGKLTADEIKKSAAAAPQPNRGGREGREGGRGPGSPGGLTDKLLTALDTNKDGVLSADELANAPVSLRTLDANKDGQLTPDEYRQAGPGGPGRGTRETEDPSVERNC